jgi:hypothetical protein
MEQQNSRAVLTIPADVDQPDSFNPLRIETDCREAEQLCPASVGAVTREVVRLIPNIRAQTPPD